MTDDTTLARARAIVTASPLTPFAEAVAIAGRQMAEEASYASLEAVRSDEAAWVAAGRPGGIDGLFSGRWTDLVNDAAAREGIEGGTSSELMVALETQFGSNPLNQGGFDEAAKERMAKAWADNEARDLKAARDAGRV